MSTTAIRDYFTDEEWDAIDQAMGDFQDYGEEDAEHADNIRYKIGMLFRKSWQHRQLILYWLHQEEW